MRVLLVNPTMTARRHARFPLSLLSLAGALAGRHECRILDGNIERDTAAALQRLLGREHFDLVGFTVMGGPQVATAIELSRATRALAPALPIAWGGYFPTLYPEATMRADYVDFAVRGQGEQALGQLLAHLEGSAAAPRAGIAGLSWRGDGEVVHNTNRQWSAPTQLAMPYDLLGDPRQYLARTFLGQRTAAHQAAFGCRFRCSFCGVAAMFRGATGLPPAAALERDLLHLRDHLGADSVQYFDHNFFDREADMLPLLEVMARVAMPWWCYARADALLDLSPHAWALVRRSRLRMAYIGAESPDDALLHDIRKGTTASQTLEVARLCRSHGVIPELSLMVAPPDDPDGATERSFEFIRQIKRVNPDAEIIVYVYTPLPSGSARHGALPARSGQVLRDVSGEPITFPRTPEEWSEPRWVDYACHADAPWLSDALRRRIRDFVTVLRCRFPTAQDIHAGGVRRATLQGLAGWRYRYRRYDNPWELRMSQRAVKLLDPQVTSPMTMHAVHVNFFPAPAAKQPHDVLQSWPALVDIAEAPTLAGVRVSVLQASHARHSLHANGVDYLFEPAVLAPHRAANRMALQGLLNSLQADVLHVHGLGFPRQTRSLATIAMRTPLLLQDHADRVPRPWRRRALRRALEPVRTVAFCALPQAEPFRRARLIHDATRIVGIPESTSRFEPGDQGEARRITGVCGDPAVLWVGHLDANKDPLTMLEGLSQVAAELPSLQLWCCYGQAPLLGEVKQLLAARSALRRRVHLLGRVEHRYVQMLMRAADLYVSASHREGSGFALLEALACGLPPVVTDIPSFRALTGEGVVGRLWQRGDGASLAHALRLACNGVTGAHRAAVREHFDRHLSLPSLGRVLRQEYERMCA